MGRLVNGVNVEFSKEEKEYIFFLNEKNAPKGCPGIWCEWCYFSSGFRKYFQVDHIIPVAGAERYAVTHDFISSVDNGCVLCVGCNGSKSQYGFPREGTGLAYRMPNQNMAYGPRRKEHLSWNELIMVAQRKGRFRRQE